MIIKRTAYANKAVWLSDYYGDQYGIADQVIVSDYPTHSPVLGPNGDALMYEPREPMGFKVSKR